MNDRGRDPVDATRCALCGEPNDCALARRAADGIDAGEGGCDRGGADAAPCWCRPQRFPAALLARARARDGGAACVCRRCLEAALARGE
ncbi:MAG: cysteine-rich CWC family protein [Myxococcota bacterium]